MDKKPTPEEIAAMEYPMEALGNVSVGNRQYAAGDIFDAVSIDSVNYLKTARAATPLSAESVTQAVAETPTEVVQTTGGLAASADPEVMETLAGVKGTTDVQSGNQVGGGNSNSRRK